MRIAHGLASLRAAFVVVAMALLALPQTPAVAAAPGAKRVAKTATGSRNAKAPQNRPKRADLERRTERITRNILQASRQRGNTGLRQRFAWHRGRAFSSAQRPVVTMNVSDNLWPLLRYRSPSSIRKAVMSSMERELDRALGEVLPNVNPELREQYGWHFTDFFARAYMVEQRQVVVETIELRSSELSGLEESVAAQRQEMQQIEIESREANAALAELDRRVTVLSQTRARSAPELLRQAQGEQGRMLGRRGVLGDRYRRASRRLQEDSSELASMQRELEDLARVRDALGVEPIGGVLPVNSEYAGKVNDFRGNPQASALRERYPQGVRYTESGFPDFEPYAAVRLTGELSSSRDRDFANANRTLLQMLTTRGLFRGSRLRRDLEGFLGKDQVEAMLEDLAKGKTPTGFTWHHHEDVESMSVGTASRRGMHFFASSERRRMIVRGDLLLVPSDLHRAASHHGGVARSKYLQAPPQFDEIRWALNRVEEVP